MFSPLTMARVASYYPVLLFALLTAPILGCARQEAPVEPSPAVAADRTPFSPPADGRLEAEQIERYLTVLRRASVLRREIAAGLAPHLQGPQKHGLRKALGAIKDGSWKELSKIRDPEERAVAELGFDLEEYRWVAERLEETELAAVEREMRQEVLWGTGDDGSSAVWVEDADLEGLSPEERALEANLALLRRYTRALSNARAADGAGDV